MTRITSTDNAAHTEPISARRIETRALVAAPVERVFAHLDDHARLSSHMSESSWMLGGGRMTIEFDEDRGRRLGSRIRLAGTVFGIELVVEEVVTLRRPPFSKAWETIGSPTLLVIGAYRMGFELLPQRGVSELRVFVEYELPQGAVGRWLGRLFSGSYAKWCTRRMVEDTVKYFASPLPERAPDANT
jgi:hypothetical protein